mgnify:CR=1 FL=1
MSSTSALLSLRPCEHLLLKLKLAFELIRSQPVPLVCVTRATLQILEVSLITPMAKLEKKRDHLVQFRLGQNSEFLFDLLDAHGPILTAAKLCCKASVVSLEIGMDDH